MLPFCPQGLESRHDGLGLVTHDAQVRLVVRGGDAHEDVAHIADIVHQERDVRDLALEDLCSRQRGGGVDVRVYAL